MKRQTKPRRRKDDLRIDRIVVRWSPDDISPEEYIVAYAEVSYRLADGTRRLETLESGGLGGITAPDPVYAAELTEEQLTDLRSHIGHFGIVVTDAEWRRLVHAART